MISSSRLNKSILSVIFFTALTFNSSFAEDETVDIWEKQEDQNERAGQHSRSARGCRIHQVLVVYCGHIGANAAAERVSIRSTR